MWRPPEEEKSIHSAFGSLALANQLNVFIILKIMFSPFSEQVMYSRWVAARDGIYKHGKAESVKTNNNKKVGYYQRLNHCNVIKTHFMF